MAAVEKDFGVWGIFSVREAAEIFLEVVSFCLVILGRGKEKKSSFGCRVVGDRGSAVRGKWAEIFRGGRSFCLVTLGVERKQKSGYEEQAVEKGRYERERRRQEEECIWRGKLEEGELSREGSC